MCSYGCWQPQTLWPSDKVEIGSHFWASTVVHTSSSKTWEAEVGGSLWVGDQPGLHSEFQTKLHSETLSQNTMKWKNKTPLKNLTNTMGYVEYRELGMEDQVWDHSINVNVLNKKYERNMGTGEQQIYLVSGLEDRGKRRTPKQKIQYSSSRKRKQNLILKWAEASCHQRSGIQQFQRPTAKY